MVSQVRRSVVSVVQQYSHIRYPCLNYHCNPSSKVPIVFLSFLLIYLYFSFIVPLKSLSALKTAPSKVVKCGTIVESHAKRPEGRIWCWLVKGGHCNGQLKMQTLNRYASCLKSWNFAQICQYLQGTNLSQGPIISGYLISHYFKFCEKI